MYFYPVEMLKTDVHVELCENIDFNNLLKCSFFFLRVSFCYEVASNYVAFGC